MDAKELLRLNVPKLREEALKVPGAIGVTGMKKDELIRLLAKAHGIVLEQRTNSAEKAHIKKHIHALKTRRDEALGRKAYEEVAHLRHGIRTLKRRVRALARTAKAQAPAATPQASS
ncbi:MAG TPA: hypothetical protein VGX03_11755 [Candidatus Binatia bacterium]|jgi:hypothetical protein|nr:hypothetical protein [Candidatus Binatia bacterium]